MAKATENTLSAPAKGHNYDAVQRAEYILKYYERRFDTDKKRKAQNDEHSKRVKADTGYIRGLGIDKEDSEDGYQKWLVNQSIQSAESDKEREKLEAKRDLKEANRAECVAVADGVEQLDFHDIMAAGKTARETLAKTEDDGEEVASAGKDGKGKKADKPPRKRRAK